MASAFSAIGIAGCVTHFRARFLIGKIKCVIAVIILFLAIAKWKRYK